MARAVPFAIFTAAEAGLRDALAQAAGGAMGVIAYDASEERDRQVRAEFLVWTLTEAMKPLAGVTALELTGIEVEREVNLAGVALAITPRFRRCRFEAGLVLCDATGKSFEIEGGHVFNIDADRLDLRGSLLLHHLEIRRQLRLCGAKIGGNLDLQRTEIGAVPAEREGRCEPALFADGLAVGGNALLDDHFLAHDEVRLNGCTIARNLDLAGATLIARGETSLSLAGARISGSLHLSHQHALSRNPDGAGFESRGTVQLMGAQITGELNCAGGRFVAPEGSEAQLAIRGESLSAGGVVRLCQGFHATGKVRFVNAKLGNDLQCRGGFFDNAGKYALVADGISVAGTCFFDAWEEQNQPSRPARTNGFLKFEVAALKQGLILTGLQFEPPAVAAIPAADTVERDGNCGLLAPFATIGGGLVLRRIRQSGAAPATGVGVVVDLHQAKADALEDDEQSWALAVGVDLAGFEYQTLKSLGPNDEWRCDVLDRQHGAERPRPPRHLGPRLVHWVEQRWRRWREMRRLMRDARRRWRATWLGDAPPEADWRVRRFEPRSYLWLAKVTQQSGYDEAATRVLIRLEENRTRFGSFGYWRLVGRGILALTVRYGYRPTHAIYVLLIWAAVSALIFTYAPRGQIVDTQLGCHTFAGPATGRGCPAALHPGHDFSAFYFAFDTLIPAVDLHQKSRWDIALPDLWPWDDLWRFVIAFIAVLNRFIGWGLGALFVAGVSGLLKAKS